MDKRSVRTKEKIVNALFELISIKSACKIKVKEITDLAKIERKTFYLHYSCIEDVYEDIRNKINNDLLKAADDYINSIDYKISDLFTYLNKIVLDNIAYLRAICNNNSYIYLMNTFESSVSSVIYNVVKNTYKVDTPNTPYYIEFYAAGIIRLYTMWLRNETNLTFEELSRILSRASFLSPEQLMNYKK